MDYTKYIVTLSEEELEDMKDLVDDNSEHIWDAAEAGSSTPYSLEDLPSLLAAVREFKDLAEAYKPDPFSGDDDYGYGLNEGSYMVAREIERILERHGLY